MGNSQIVVLILLVVTITLLLNLILRHQLYWMGVDLILSMQRHSSPAIDSFFIAITMLIDPLAVLMLTVLVVVLPSRKDHALRVLCFVLLNTFFAALVKAYDCDPRPIWTTSKVVNIGFYCPVEYGNPSGHSWFSTVIGFGVFVEFWGSGPKYRNLVLSVVLMILVPLSRMYLGAHSLNQVLEGLVLGLASCLLFRLGLDQLIDRFLKEFRHSRKWQFGMVILHMLAWGAYALHMEKELPENWMTNIEAKCRKGLDEQRLNQLMLVINALMLNLLTGLALGYAHMGDSQVGKCFLEGSYNIGKGKVRFAAIAVQMGVILAALLIGALVGTFFNRFQVWYVGLSLGGLGSGYSYCALTHRSLITLGLIQHSKQVAGVRSSQERKHQ